jgi:hypothetical protein
MGIADQIDPLHNLSVADGSLRFRSPEDRAAQGAATESVEPPNFYVRD